MIAELAMKSGVRLKSYDDPSLLAACRREMESGHRTALLDCVLGATDEAAVRACIADDIHGDAPSHGVRTLRRIQQELELNLQLRHSSGVSVRTDGSPATSRERGAVVSVRDRCAGPTVGRHQKVTPRSATPGGGRSR